MRRITFAFVGLLAAAVIAAPAGADFHFFPVLDHTPTYLVCEGTTKLAQANFAIDGAETIGWDEVAPSRSVQQAAGCASAESFASGDRNPNAVLDLPMAGTFTGNLTAMTVRLYSIDPTARAFNSQSLVVDLIIDGRTRLTDADIDVTRAPTAIGMGFYEFSITNIGLLTELDSTMTHTVEVQVSTRYIDQINGWVWDATEYPSGITFNPSRLAASRIRG